MRWLVVILAGCLGVVVTCGSAVGDPCRDVVCQQTDDGVAIGVVDTEGSSAVAENISSAGKQGTVEHSTTPGCPLNDPNAGGPYDVACSYMTSACISRGQPGAWLVWVWSRPVGSQIPWVRSGSGCRSPQQVQAAAPGVTRALVQRAFRQVRFAHPRVHVQPEGNVTLVNLATYYQVRWPTEGFEPAEVATVNLLGRTVRLRPRVVSYTYRFGDGSSLGPTSDAGGTYPSGRVRHTYVRPGEVPVSVEVVYSGDYQLGGGAWEPVDLTVPVAGEPVRVQVRQARARLEAPPPRG